MIKYIGIDFVTNNKFWPLVIYEKKKNMLYYIF